MNETQIELRRLRKIARLAKKMYSELEQHKMLLDLIVRDLCMAEDPKEAYKRVSDLLDEYDES